MTSGTSLHTFSPDVAAIEAAITALEDLPFGCVERDATIFRALGWQVLRPSGRAGWRMRSPVQTGFQPMPWPSIFVHDAARLVPHGWGWGVGVARGIPYAAVSSERGADPPYFETSGTTVALALTKAALLGHRWCAMRQAVPA